MKRNMHNLFQLPARALLLLLAAWCAAAPGGYAQSGSFGNTFIFAGAEMAVNDSTHNFQNGGNGTLPGIIGTERTAPQGFFSFVGTATYSAAANGAHVDGYVCTYETQPFVFPIGDNGKYRPAAVSVAAAGAPTNAAYFGVNPATAITSSLKGGNEPVLPFGGPFATSALGTGLLAVNATEYWDINGATAATITLTWDAASGINALTTGNLNSLTIVGWNGSQWVAIPSTVDATSILGGASSLSSGSITTNTAFAPDTYSVYTLGAMVTDTDGDGIVDASDSAPNDPCAPAQAAGYTGYDATNTIWLAGDCDRDGVTNGTEHTNGSDPYNSCDPISASSADADTDGLTDCEETTGQDNPNTPPNPNGNTSNPNDSDSDNDGLNDGAEATNGSNPNSSDTDGDGLSDNEEVTGVDDSSTPGNPNGNTSSPSNSDTDGDGLNDCDESSICVPNGTPTSTLFGNTHVASGAETGLFGVVSLQGVSTTDRSSSYGAYSFTKMASWVNASDANHIDGYVKKYGATPFTFPVGDNGAFRPVSMSGFATSGQTATAAYFAAAPVSPSALGAGVSAVSAVEYWDIDGTAATRLTLTWDASSDVTALTGSTLSALTILGWNGSQWVAIPSTVAATTLNESSACSEFTATAGTLTVGAITTNAALNPSTYQYYTLGALSATLNVKVLLQGALFDTATPGIMRDDLRSGAHLPLNDPYTNSSNARFTHYGTGALATTTNAVLNANAGTNDAIVDWVFIELRSAANAGTVIETRAALVQKDGDVVSPVDGTSPLIFSGFTGQSFYVSVKHRNHLGAMTAAAIAMTGAGTTVDFTTMSNADLYNQAGYDGAEMVTIGAVKALWAGNANADTKTKYQGANNDGAIVLSDVLSHPDNTAGAYNFNLGFGYWYGDINMDGKVKYQGMENDLSIIFYSLISAYTLNGFDLYNYDLMREQLP